MRESYLFVFSRCGIYLRYRQPVRVWERVPSQLRLLRVQPAPIIAKIFPVFHRPLWHLVKPPCKVLLVSKMNFPVTTPMLLLTTGKFDFGNLAVFANILLFWSFLDPIWPFDYVILPRKTLHELTILAFSTPFECKLVWADFGYYLLLWSNLKPLNQLFK